MMRDAVLLDTCALLWLGMGSGLLSLAARETIEETETVFVSPVSLWEISNKHRQGKLKLALPPREWFDRVCEKYRLTTLPISNETMFLAGELEEHHRDPADRMIIAAAKLADVAVITADHNFQLYGIDVIR